MSTCQMIVQYLASDSPFRNGIYASWAEWGRGTQIEAFQMTRQDVERLTEAKLKGSKFVTRAQRRPWNINLDYVISLIDTFYRLERGNLGNFYEQYIRSLMGAYYVTQKNTGLYLNQKPRLPDIVKDDPEIMNNIREKMVVIWSLPKRYKWADDLMDSLNDQKTFPELGTYFLENSPMMQNALNIRRGAAEEILTFTEITIHNSKEGLLNALRGLLEDLCMKNGNMAGVKINEQLEPTKMLSVQVGTQDWLAAYPDLSEGKLPPFPHEFGIRSQNMMEGDELVTITAEVNGYPGHRECREDLQSNGNKTTALRAQIVQLMILDNVFIDITDQFMRYFCDTTRNIRRWDSYYGRIGIQKQIFSDAIIGKTMTKSNHEIFKSILSRAAHDDGPALNQAGGWPPMEEENEPGVHQGLYQREPSEGGSIGSFGPQTVVEINPLPIFLIGGAILLYFVS